MVALSGLRRAATEVAEAGVALGKRAMKKATAPPRLHELEVVLSNSMCKAAVRPYRPKQVSTHGDDYRG
jgi:hypothetical protein